MTFEVTADSYARFMGRFSEPLADLFVAHLGLEEGQTALDVGCGPGALTGRLAAVLGESAVTAVDPMDQFLDVVRRTWPGVRALVGAAEHLPVEDDAVDVTLAQLVVHFMADPVAGLREMRRATRPGGRVAATVWDLAGDSSPLSDFWAAARDLDPEVTTEEWMPGARAGHLRELFAQAGMEDAAETTLTIHVRFATFDEWWEPFTFGVGPAGAYAASLDAEGQAGLRAAAAARLSGGPVEITGSAWTVVARV